MILSGEEEEQKRKKEVTAFSLSITFRYSSLSGCDLAKACASVDSPTLWYLLGNLVWGASVGAEVLDPSPWLGSGKYHPS